MRRDVEWVREGDRAMTAGRKMRDANVGILPVCDDANVVVGVLTDRDLAVRVCAEGRSAATTTVGEIMTAQVVACRPGHPIGHAEALMARHRISRVLVTERDGKLLGVLSLSDLAQYERPLRIARTLGQVTERKYRSEAP